MTEEEKLHMYRNATFEWPPVYTPEVLEWMRTFAASQTDVPPEAAKVLDDNFWDLLSPANEPTACNPEQQIAEPHHGDDSQDDPGHLVERGRKTTVPNQPEEEVQDQSNHDNLDDQTEERLT